MFLKVYISTRRSAWLIKNKINGKTPWDVRFNSRFQAFGRKIVPKFIRNYFWEKSSCLDLSKFSAILPKHHFLRFFCKLFFKFFSTHFTFAQTLAEHLQTGKVEIKQNLLSFVENNGVEFDNGTIIENIDEV